jgi:SAM-dependent methyltransferase
VDYAVYHHVNVLALHHRWLVGGFVGYQDRVLSAARQFWRTRVPVSARSRINAFRRERREASWRRPRKLGELRRATPFPTWGADRGGSIPRFFIAEFLEQNAEDIRGRVLEVAGDRYIRQFGKGVSHADILDIRADNPRATFVADFADAPNVPANTFDCLVVTQILSWVYDLRAPFQTAHRLLVPGGVFLATTPGIARLAPIESQLFGEWWHFTSMAAKRVGEEVFGVGNVEVQAFGNVLAAAGTLYGLGRYDLSREELVLHDPGFEVIVAIRAVKPLR